jgi:ferritin-like metal-binding protein YciE
LAKDADWVIKNVKDPQALDANLIAAAQYVEHYEIAGYGTAREWAQIMGHDNAIRLLDETLKEESATDKKLTELAVTDINEMANDMKE